MAWEILHNAKVLQNTDTGELGIRCGRSNEVTRVTEAREYTIPDFGYKAGPLDADMSPDCEDYVQFVGPLVEGKTYTYAIGGEMFTGVCFEDDGCVCLGDTTEVLAEAANNNDFSGVLGHQLYAEQDGTGTWLLWLWSPKYMTEHPDDDTAHVTSQDIKMVAAIQALPAGYTRLREDSIVNATLLYEDADAVYEHLTGDAIQLLFVGPIGSALTYLDTGVTALLTYGDSAEGVGLYLGCFTSSYINADGVICAVSGTFNKVAGTLPRTLYAIVSTSMEAYDEVNDYQDGYWTQL